MTAVGDWRQNLLVRVKLSVPDTYTDNRLNQYTAVGAASPTYDSRGNMTGDGAKTYAYDYSNRLTSVNSTSVLLSYDPSGRLWGLGGSLVADTEFLYDGVDVIAEYDPGGSVVRRYVHGPGMDEPLVWFEGAGHSGSGTPDRRHLYADERGSIVAVEGSSVTVNTYDEYGVPGSGNTGRFQYTGQMWLAGADLYHYKARAYSPELGRFMQTDPIGYGDGMNIYAYVGNDPINAIDPKGTTSIYDYRSGSIDQPSGEYGGVYITNPLDTGNAAVNFFNAQALVASGELSLARFLKMYPGVIEVAVLTKQEVPGACTAVSDTGPFSGVDFSSACRSHDRCYATTGMGLKGKGMCDAMFLQSMLSACKGNLVCQGDAWLYYGGVSFFGHGPFIYEQNGPRARPLVPPK